MIETLWLKMQIELLDTSIWSTRLERGNMIFEYLESWPNRQRPHGRLGGVAPTE